MAEEDKVRSSSTRNIAEALAIYAAVPTATMYPLGLLVLWLQISYSYGESLSSAWFAANLVPPAALVGMGITAVWDLLNELKYILLLLIIAGSIVAFPRRKKRYGALEKRYGALEKLLKDVEEQQDLEKRRAHLEKAKEENERLKRDVSRSVRDVSRGVRIPLLDYYWLGPRWILVLVGLLILYMVVGWVFLATRGHWAEAAASIILLLSSLGALIVLVKDGFEAEKTGFQRRRWFLRGLAITFLGVLVASIVESGIRDPMLPKVLITNGTDSMEATLLTHREQYWYVFDEDEQFRAIPEEGVGEVRFVEAP